MKELTLRIVFGCIYTLLVISSLYFSVNYFIVWFTILATATLYEFLKLHNIQSFTPYLLMWALLYVSMLYQDTPTQMFWYLSLFACAINLLLAVWLYKGTLPLQSWQTQLVLWAYFLGGFVILSRLAFLKTTFNPLFLVLVFVLIWSNDTLAFFIGKNFGKRKLFPKVSPNKTVEGFLGGGIATVITACLIPQFIKMETNTFLWIVIGLVISVLGPLGDLIQSKFKRLAGVKNSGVLLPGHGGIYDRLDSVLYTAPFIYLIFKFLENVS